MRYCVTCKETVAVTRADNVRVASASGGGKTQRTTRCPISASRDAEIAAPYVSVEPRSHVSAQSKTELLGAFFMVLRALSREAQ
ncbi:unnamed protein product [Didymodactylos carnosus]|uniref:Uncharacterized protein n=1 Tax=Didymodactylos carnosus TaxID=1234261 RepID=A0A814BFB2_9BILA|nr:unnamed protein product [Didymodactylos carnosus]CAF3704003.1 unnamed protein product [Didymodactylos carnosus]